MSIDVHSKQFWVNYVQEAQYEAGKYLDLKDSDAIKATYEHGISHPYRPIIFNYTNRSWNWDFSSRTTYVAPSTSASSSSRSEEERRSSAQAMVVGIVATLAGALLFGFAYKAYSRQKETLNYTNQVENQFIELYQGNAGNPLLENIRELLGRQHKIDTLNTSKINKYALSALGILAGGAILAIGGYTAVPWMITAGGLALVVSTALPLFTLAYHWSDKEDIAEQYKKIIGSKNPAQVGIADTILSQLGSLIGDHVLSNTYGKSNFVPFYPEFYPPSSAPPMNE